MLAIAQEAPQEVYELLRQSDGYSAAVYPAESRHPTHVDALSAPEVRFFVARRDGQAIGCGALVLGRDGHAEIKRMFVDPMARGQGVGRAILQTIEETATREGVHRIRLETGVHNREALALYRRHGYSERQPFGSYRHDPLSVFMEKEVVPKGGPFER
jgi:putative acetyltransferase